MAGWTEDELETVVFRQEFGLANLWLQVVGWRRNVLFIFFNVTMTGYSEGYRCFLRLTTVASRA